jgi:hypothetical protein
VGKYGKLDEKKLNVKDIDEKRENKENESKMVEYRYLK